jgi:hypothetical protein
VHAALDAHAGEQHCRRRERDRPDCEHDPDIGERHEHPGPERADERSEPLHRRSRAVRGDQLLRRPRERRQERLERRSDERRGEPDEPRKDEDEHLVLAGVVRRSRSGQRGRSDQRDSDEEALTPEAIAERGSKRRDQRGGQQANEPRDPDGHRAAGVVREDAKRARSGPTRP